MAKTARGIGWHPVVWRFGSAVLSILALLIISIPDCSAQTAPAVRRQGSALAPELKAISERMNANTLTVVTGTPSGIFSTFAADLSAVLNDGDELRIMGVTSQGAFQNVRP
jgi:hypothetical protein